MKHHNRALAPARAQKLRMTAAGLNSYDWLVVSDSSDGMLLLHRGGGLTKRFRFE